MQRVDRFCYLGPGQPALCPQGGDNGLLSITRDPNNVTTCSSLCASPSSPDPGNLPQPPSLSYLRKLSPACRCDSPGPHPWGSRMGASARALSFLLLGLLLTSFPGALGANPGLVTRITDKGLEYGKKLWPLAGLADLLGTRLLWVPWGHQRGTLSQAVWPSQPGVLGSDSGLVTQALCHLGIYLS